jgi:hypothetical protein
MTEESFEQRKARRLAEIDGWIAEHKRKDKEREARHSEEVARLLDEAAQREAKQVSDAVIAAQDELVRRLRDLDLVDADEEPKRLSVTDPATGEFVVGLETDDRTRYAFAGAGAGDTLVMKRRLGPTLWLEAVLDENGKPINWYPAPPPGASAPDN